MTEQIWKPIKGFDYEVSNDGEVRSADGSLLKKHTTHGRTGKVKYHQVVLKNLGKTKHKLVHRLVAETFIENKDKPEVNHKDGNGQNNHVDNLEWVTRSENAIHSRDVLKNFVIGTEREYSKLDDEKAKTIREDYKSGKAGQREMARKYGVTQGTIWAVINYRTWKHV